MRQPLTTQTVLDELQRLLTAFPRRGDQNLTRLADVYRAGLVGVETDALRAAAGRCIQEDEFFPKVARLRSLADEWMRRNRGAFAPTIRDRWNICPTCGAVALPRQITRPTRGGPRGELETVESQGLYMDHLPGPHHVHDDAS